VLPGDGLIFGADAPSHRVACVEALTSILSWDTVLNDVNHQVIWRAILVSCGSVGIPIPASLSP
jgi:hypothetical protein